MLLTWLSKVAKGNLKVVEDARGCQSCDGSVVAVVKSVQCESLEVEEESQRSSPPRLFIVGLETMNLVLKAALLER